MDRTARNNLFPGSRQYGMHEKKCATVLYKQEYGGSRSSEGKE